MEENSRNSLRGINMCVTLACEQAHLIGKGGGAATDREQAKPARRMGGKGGGAATDREQAKPARRMGRGKVSLHASY